MAFQPSASMCWGPTLWPCVSSPWYVPGPFPSSTPTDSPGQPKPWRSICCLQPAPTASPASAHSFLLLLEGGQT